MQQIFDLTPLPGMIKMAMAYRLFLSTTIVALALVTSHAQELQVGAAQIDITPPVGYRCGGGYGEVISTGIDDPLYAKAIVLKQGSQSGAIVMSDLLSVPPDLSAAARDRASALTGIPTKNIIVAATHNHGSPEYWGSLRDVAHSVSMQADGKDPHESVDYQQKLVQAWSDAIKQASDQLRPAIAEFSVAQQPGIAFNRRFHMADGTVRCNPGIGNPNIVRPAGPIDNELPILLWRASDDDATPIVSMTTLAMHTAVHGGSTFSGDFPAVLQSKLQDVLGQKFISVFAEGAAGDINHIDVTNKHALRGRAEVRRIGEALSKTVLNEIPRLSAISSPNLAFASHTTMAPFQKVTESRYREAFQQLREQKKTKLPFMTLVAAWRDCHRWRYTQKFPDGQKPLFVQGIRLNSDLAIIALPHEVFVEIGMAIKATSPFRNTIVVSLSGDVDYYIPTRRAFSEGSYEVTTCPLAPGCGELLLDCARKVLTELKAI